MWTRIVPFLLLATIASAALPADTTTWVTHDVLNWIDTLGTPSVRNVKEGVIKYGITGNILLVLEDQDVRDELGVQSHSERNFIMGAIQKLKDTDAEQRATLTFWELRALNRKMVDYTVPLLTLAPRWAITTFDDFPEYCRPKTALGEGHSSPQAWLEWALVPEWYIYIHSNSIMCGLPGFVPWVCLASLLGTIFTLTGILIKGEKVVPTLFDFFVKKLGAEVTVGVSAWLYANLIWPIIPWFLCDIFFYMSVYVAPVLAIFMAVLVVGVVTGGVLTAGLVGAALAEQESMAHRNRMNYNKGD